MNHLQEAKSVADVIAQNRDGSYEQYGILHALIAIAEQLERMNASKQEIYDQGYDAGIENLEAEIEYATKGMDK